MTYQDLYYERIDYKELYLWMNMLLNRIMLKIEPHEVATRTQGVKTSL